MRNHQITRQQRLLNEHGQIRECGWSTSQLQEYHRKDIKAASFRIKEWDYYLILANDFGIAMTVSDDGYIGLQSISFLNFLEGYEHTETKLNLFPMGKFHLPSSSSQGPTVYKDKRMQFTFEVLHGKRHLTASCKHFMNGKDLSCDILLAQPDMDTMVIATPWSTSKTACYYNQKINCMRASGTISLGNQTYTFDPQTNFGTLDWGRGVWTYDNTWYWGSGNIDLHGKAFGFNVGYGFGDTSAATENVLFYEGIAHKLDDVTFHIPSDHMQSWTITSSDHRFDMCFTPALDRSANISALIISSNQHQVFGYLDGIAILDDGTALELTHMLCFFEFVHNRY